MSAHNMKSAMETIRVKLNPTAWGGEIWRKFFLVAALWNLSGAIPGILMPGLNLRLFYGIQTTDFHMLLLNTMFWGAVLVFGIGYLLVAKNPEKNPGIVVLGVISKTLVAVVWYYLYFFCDDRATILVVGGATGDVVFTGYFVYYLMRGAKTE